MTAGSEITHESKSMSASQKPFAIGGVGAQPTLDDVVRIAHGQIVSLDPAGADRVKKLSPPPKQFQAEPWSDASGVAAAATGLKATQIRAIVAAKLLALMNGRSGVRLQLCEFLSQVRCGSVLPHAPRLRFHHAARPPCACPPCMPCIPVHGRVFSGERFHVPNRC